MSGVNWEDLLKQAEVGNKPAPAGPYELEITDAKHKKSSNGRDMYSVRTKIVGGPYAGKTIWHNFVLSTDNPNALSIFFRQMAFLGLGPEFFAQRPSHEQVAQALVGTRFKAEVEVRQWNGEDRNNVKSASPPSTPNPAKTPGQGGGAVPQVPTVPQTPSEAPPIEAPSVPADPPATPF